MSPSFPTRRSSVLDARPVTLVATYMVAGTSYTPADIVDYDAVGYASRYGDGRAGQPTANGERFDPDAISAAHKTLPLPSYVEVTALDTGRTILVRVNDRGQDRKSVVEGKSVSVRVDLGGRRIIKKKKK